MHLFRSALGRRLLIALAIGLGLAWALSEAAFLLLKDQSDHAPRRVELVIPAGTAQRVAMGEAVPSLPKDMVFVAGDVLVVKNEDTVAHQLGPVWAPPGATASLRLDQANQYSYACTFQPSRYLGVDVRPRVTARTRILAVLMAGPPMGILIGLYSLALWPLRPKGQPSAG